MIAPAMRAFAVTLFAFALATPADAADTPRQPVLQLNAALLKVMRNAGALGFDGRYRVLAPVLTRVFNFPIMARVAAGRHWRDLSPAQRERLIDAFTRMSIATFAARFDGYSGERFEVLGERPALRGSVMVKNQVLKPSGKIVPINYLLRKFQGEWRVIDVYLDAKYSELAIKRSEYGSVLKRRGFDGLIRSLDDKIAELKARAAS